MGRLSSVITLRNGVIVSPDVLEGIYAISPLLSQCYLYGNESMEGLLAIVSSTDNFDEKWREIDVDMNAIKRCLLNEFSSIARRNGLREEVCIACSYLL
jgi:long-subunit acyl-CoA synthetase (AMP-forming)